MLVSTYFLKTVQNIASALLQWWHMYKDSRILDFDSSWIRTSRLDLTVLPERVNFTKQHKQACGWVKIYSENKAKTRIHNTRVWNWNCSREKTYSSYAKSKFLLSKCVKYAKCNNELAICSYDRRVPSQVITLLRTILIM